MNLILIIHIAAPLQKVIINANYYERVVLPCYFEHKSTEDAVLWGRINAKPDEAYSEVKLYEASVTI